jgi:ATP-dependent DNA helicase RecQ
MPVNVPDLRQVLRTEFGFEQFRPGQERMIRDLLAGRDVLGVLPTGGGKSLVYQLASQLVPGVTLVVSPLLALMRDQLDALAERGLEAAAVNSLQTERETDLAVEQAQRDKLKLLYVTPERFEDADFMAAARRMSVSLFVVDEAHSISEWGHSFRPAYLQLGEAARALGRPTVLALTATASPWVRRDITQRLELRQPDVVVVGVDRPNLYLEVVRVDDEQLDRRTLRRLLVDHESDEPLPSEHAEALRHTFDGSGIIYTATTREASDTARWLRSWGISADFYHGQRRKRDRERVQDEFMSGRIRVIAATNAFGMGIDKPDVRFVVHRDITPSLEAYYQEAGRAGRDGEVARCTLIYRPGELGRAAFLGASGANPEFERSRLEMMRHYAEAAECRRRFLLDYFGAETEVGRCGFCDVDARAGSVPEPEPAAPFVKHERVRHPSWGEGVVQRVVGESIVVLFESVGYKTLAADIVEQQQLLTPLPD